MKTLMLIVFFLLIGAFFIIAENNIYLNSPRNIGEFLGLYIDWMGEITGNAQTVSGYMTKMEWLPGEG
jgi:hypothetical protein